MPVDGEGVRWKATRQSLAEPPRGVAAGGRRFWFAGPGGAPGRRQAAARPPADPLAPRPPHSPARARRVIFLFMPGGPSQVDTFDPKPRLNRDHGKPAPKALPGPDEEAAGLALEIPQAG